MEKDSLANAPNRVAEDAREFGAVPNHQLTPMQQMQLQGLAAAKNDASPLSRLVESLNGRQ
jgi:hypothetical protein